MRNPEGEIEIGRRLAKRLYPLTLAVGFLISGGLPATYYVLQSAALRQAATISAENISHRFQVLVVDAPSLWKYQTYKYNQILGDFLHTVDVTSLRILDEAGRVITAYEHRTAKAEAWWNRYPPAGSAPITFNNRVVGTVQVGVSRGAVLGMTLALLLLSTGVGIGLAVLLYVFPVKVVRGLEKERTRLRAAAQASEQRFRDLVQGLDAIVWEADLPAATAQADAATFQFSFVSQRAEAILGYPVEQWMSEPDFWANHIHPDDRERAVALCREAISEGRDHQFDYRALAADGRVVRIRDVVAVVKAEGEDRRLRGVMVDVTERKRAEERLAERTRQLEAVRAVTEEITRELDLSTVLALITRRAAELFGDTSAVLYLWDERDQVLIPEAWHGFGEWVRDVRPRMGEGVAGVVAQRREGMIVGDYRAFPAAYPLALERTGIRAVISEPLFYHDRLVGVINVNSESVGRAFTEHDREVLALFAAQAAIAIENARLHEAARREVSERTRAQETLHALYRASLQVQEPLEMKDRLTRLLEAARDVLDLDRFNVLLPDAEGRRLQAVASLGTEEALETIWVPIGPEGGGLAQAYLTHRTIVWDGRASVPEDLRLQPPYDQIEAFRSRVFAIVPLVVQGRTMGILGVDRKHSRRPLDPVTVELLHLFAGQAAIAIENARLFQQEQEGRRQLEAVRAVTAEIIRELDLTSLLRLVSRRAAELTGAVSSAVYLWDEGAQALAPQAWHGFGEWMREVRLRLGEGITGTAAQQRAGLIVNDYRTSPYASGIFLERTGITATVAEPLLFGDRLIGVITINNEGTGRSFTGEDRETLALFAAQAAIAIENSRLYQEIRQHATTLEARVRERTTELQTALNVKTEFLGRMSHELRTPLNFVIGFSELLRRETAGPLTPKQATYVDRIYTGGQQLLGLVTNVLDIAETETSTGRLHLAPVPLAPLAQEILGAVAVRVAQKRLAVTSRLDPGLPAVVADRGRLTQILANLVENAVKFTPDGGTVRLTSRLVDRVDAPSGESSGLLPRSPEPPISREGRVAELAVEDTGVGIPPEMLERIFEPFHQVDGSVTRTFGGAGLGLALVRKLVEMHGGRIWAESAGPGQGSRFVVQLPLLPAPRARRILLVEDEAPLREGLATVLEMAGYAVEQAGTGAQAQAALTGKLPDLLILDIGLPDMDGREILRRVRRTEETRALPVLVLIGLEHAPADQALALGADEFLSRPVSARVLTETVARLLA
jgi:PAS domain S-box-containing protein